MGVTQKSSTDNTTAVQNSKPSSDAILNPPQAKKGNQGSADLSQMQSALGSAYSDEAIKSPQDRALDVMGIDSTSLDLSQVNSISDAEKERIEEYSKSELGFLMEGLTTEVLETLSNTPKQKALMTLFLHRQEALKSNVVVKDMSSTSELRTGLYERGSTSSINVTKESGTRSGTERAEYGQTSDHVWEDASGVHLQKSQNGRSSNQSISHDDSTFTRSTSVQNDEDDSVRKTTVTKVSNQDRATKLEATRAENSKKKLSDRVETTATILEAKAAKDIDIGGGKIEGETDLGGGTKASGSLEANTLNVNAKAGAYYDPKKGLKVGGSAGAKYTLVGGNAKLTAGPYGFNMMGEKMRSEFTVGLSAGVVAEANGAIDLNVSKGAKGVGVEVDTPAGIGTSAKLSGFAGAKAGIEAGAKLDWGKKPDYRFSVEDYTRKMVQDYLGSYTDYVPDYLFNEFSEHFAAIVIGNGGWENLAAIKAGVEGTAGIGGEASYNLGLQGGRVKCSGTLQGTVGVGVGGKIGLDLDALDGVRFLGLMLFRTADKILKAFGISPSQIYARLDKKIQKAKKWLGKEIYDVGTSGKIDYVIPDSVAGWCANKLGYAP